MDDTAAGNARPGKLGLALSGGGFRASLFHLGVLKRLAELDLLRQVSVLSTVSGGSIIGAHYYLRLKRALEEGRSFSYPDLIRQVETEFCAAMEKNLRTRLFLSPFVNLAMLCLGKSMGRCMARLYTRHIYRRVIRELYPEDPGYLETGVPLRIARVRLDAGPWADPLRIPFAPPGSGVVATLDLRNRARDKPVPKLILNATCLNTGREFRFTVAEIGDPRSAYFRFDEIWLLVVYKSALFALRASAARKREETSGDEAREVIARASVEFQEHVSPEHRRGTDAGPYAPVPFGPYAGEHLLWWIHVERLMQAAQMQAPPRALREYLDNKRNVTSVSVVIDTAVKQESGEGRLLVAFTKHVMVVEFGLLRRAKIAAWFLLHPEVEQAETRWEWIERFWGAIDDIDTASRPALRERFGDDAMFLHLVMDFFYIRSADAAGWSAPEVMASISLSEAVAASANFPPFFPPFEILGLYDPRTVRVLALTDGGVYDNQGLTALFEERCTHIIASDAGGLSRVEPHPAWGRAGMMMRIADTLMANLRDWQLRFLREKRRTSEALDALYAAAPQPKPPAEIEGLRALHDVKAVAFFHMTSNPDDAIPAGPPPLAPHPNADLVARLRTDLDLFTEIERDALIYQGYQLADRFVRTYMPDLVGAEIVPSPNPQGFGGAQGGVDAAAVEKALAAGHHRFGRLLVFVPWLKWVILAVVLAAGWYFFHSRSLLDVLRCAGAAVEALARTPLLVPWLRVPIDEPGAAVWFVIGAVVIGWMWWTWPKWEQQLAETASVASYRRRFAGLQALRAIRFLGLWRRNIFWFVGLLPLWLALAGSVIAGVILAVIDRLILRFGRRRYP